MIHEVLLQLISYSDNSLDIASNLDGQALSFLHPAEIQIYKQIMELAKQYGHLQSFIKNNRFRKDVQASVPTAGCLPLGLYLQALCEGLDEALAPYMDEVLSLEKKSLLSPPLSLSMVLTQMSKHSELISSLTNIIKGAAMWQLHGCLLLQHLHNHLLSGSETVIKAVKIVFRHVQKVFYHHLTTWLLYGDLVDIHREFFIEQVILSETIDSHETNTSTETAVSNTEFSSNHRFWDYNINVALLPQYISPTLAHKVLFIGQTVIMFKSDPRRNKVYDVDHSIWGEMEYQFFQKLVDNQHQEFSISILEAAIDEIKSFVTEHLFALAVQDADLFRQLSLIKDYYFLGRGELFLEFIRLASGTLNPPPVNIDNVSKEVNVAFVMAARNMFISDEIDAFRLSLQNNIPKAELDPSSRSQVQVKQEVQSPEERDGWSMLTLRYSVQWPLHLLFTPPVMDHYNELFRFLLRVKRTQLELHAVWGIHRPQTKTKRYNNSQVLIWQLRHKLIFLLEHLQYYLQVDVLESQSSVLHQTIAQTRDFEAIQRAHTVFQTNVLSQCFLLVGSNDENFVAGYSVIDSKNTNPVHKLLNQVLRLCNLFCMKAVEWSKQESLTKDNLDDLKCYDISFTMFMETLLKLFSGLRSQPCGAHLSQLLLRLDFNRWFSHQTPNNQSDTSLDISG